MIVKPNGHYVKWYYAKRHYAEGQFSKCPLSFELLSFWSFVKDSILDRILREFRARLIYSIFLIHILQNRMRIKSKTKFYEHPMPNSQRILHMILIQSLNRTWILSESWKDFQKHNPMRNSTKCTVGFLQIFDLNSRKVHG